MKRSYFFLFFVLTAVGAFASHGDLMPILDPLEKILNFITGPVVKVLGGFLIVGGGIGFAISPSDGIKKLLAIIGGIGIVVYAVSFITGLFNISSGMIL